MRTQAASRAPMRLAISAAAALVKVRQRIDSGAAPLQQQAQHARGQDLRLARARPTPTARHGPRGSAASACSPRSSGSGLKRAFMRLPNRARRHMLTRMTDDDTDEEGSKERRDKLVKAGVAVGIGSAAIVAALLYASKVKKKKKR